MRILILALPKRWGRTSGQTGGPAGPTPTEGQAQGPTPTRRNWRWALLVVGLVCLGFCLFAIRERGSGFRWDVFASTFLHLRPQWVLAAAIFSLLTYCGRVIRWKVMLKPLRPHPSNWGLFSATAIGFTALVLFGRPGEFVRPYLISVKERVPFSSQLAAWVVERIYDLLVVLLVFGFALSRVYSSGAVVGPTLQWVLKVGGTLVAVASTGCLVSLFLLGQFCGKMGRLLLRILWFLPSPYRSKVEKILVAFEQGVGAMRSPYALLLLIFYTLMEWVLISGCYYCLFPGLMPFKLLDVAVFVGFVSFGSIIQIPGVGGGIQLMAVVTLTELFGVPLEMASGVAIMVWLITFIIIVPLGLVLALREGLNLQKLKDLEVEAGL
jgi:uncharacterized protein (TIRG00374 family)